MSETLTITPTFSADEVQVYLTKKDFDQALRNTLLKFDGQSLLGMSESSVLKLCGNGEGDRLLGLLNFSKSMSNPPRSENRMEKIVNSLKKCGIKTDCASAISTLGLIARHDRYLDAASVSTELALETYKNIRDTAGTMTKSCIGEEIDMKVNGSVFDEFPFILSAHNSCDEAKLVKILRVAEGTSDRRIRESDVRYEAESVKFSHFAIVPMERKSINIDMELATKVCCRLGYNEVLIMPWYTSTLNKHPSNCLKWIAREGKRILEALKFLHNFPERGFAHIDVKAANVFVDHANNCFLGDFGSCKPIGERITSCSINYCWEDIRGKPAHQKYDYFMFLVMLLIECLEDRRLYPKLLYEENSHFVSIGKLIEATNDRISNNSTPLDLRELLLEVLNKLLEYGVA